jgi:cell division protein FtsW
MGVNMGILPTKGLTLPLISSGGSSVLMTCAAFGMLLRVSCELDRAERRHAARLRGDGGRVEPAFDDAPEPAWASDAPQAQPATPVLAPGRGKAARVEPRFGAQR